VLLLLLLLLLTLNHTAASQQTSTIRVNTAVGVLSDGPGIPTQILVHGALGPCQ